MHAGTACRVPTPLWEALLGSLLPQFMVAMETGIPPFLEEVQNQAEAWMMPPYGMPAMPRSAYGTPVGQVGFVSNVGPTGQFGFCVQCGNPKVDSNPFCGICGHRGPSSSQLPAPEPHPTQPIRQESSVAISVQDCKDAGVSAGNTDAEAEAEAAAAAAKKKKVTTIIIIVVIIIAASSSG